MVFSLCKKKEKKKIGKLKGIRRKSFLRNCESLLFKNRTDLQIFPLLSFRALINLNNTSVFYFIIICANANFLSYIIHVNQAYMHTSQYPREYPDGSHLEKCKATDRREEAGHERNGGLT